MAMEPAAISARPAVTTRWLTANGTRDARRQRERDSEAVRHPDHHIANRVAGGEMLLRMLRVQVHQFGRTLS
jgi:hypothetical protein